MAPNRGQLDTWYEVRREAGEEMIGLINAHENRTREKDSLVEEE